MHNLSNLMFLFVLISQASALYNQLMRHKNLRSISLRNNKINKNRERKNYVEPILSRNRQQQSTLLNKNENEKSTDPIFQ